MYMLHSLLSVNYILLLYLVQSTSNPQQLNYRLSSAYDWIWNDKNSGSNKNGAFWKPTLNSGELYISQVNTVSWTAPTENSVVITSAPDGVLAEPNGWTWLWDDVGTGGSYDVTFARPTAPTGYTCIGDFVFREYTAPTWDGYKCVRNDYIHIASGSSTIKWDDTGSGRLNYNTRVFKITVPTAPFSYYKIAQGDPSTFPSPYYIFYEPTPSPTIAPTTPPTYSPTLFPTYNPTQTPTIPPTSAPTTVPTTFPSIYPTFSPTLAPTISPTNAPTSPPTISPSNTPTTSPTIAPTFLPTIAPTITPTRQPTNAPTFFPTLISDYNVSYKYIYKLSYINYIAIDIRNKETIMDHQILNANETVMYLDDIDDIIEDAMFDSIYFQYHEFYTNINVSSIQINKSVNFYDMIFSMTLFTTDSRKGYPLHNFASNQFIKYCNEMFKRYFNEKTVFKILYDPGIQRIMGENSITSVNFMYKIFSEFPTEILLCLMFISYLILICIAKLVAIEKNNTQFSITKILRCGLRMLDYVSDLFSAIIVVKVHVGIGIGLLGFSILPGFIAVYMTQKKINHWIKTESNGPNIAEWFLDYSMHFYLACLITGDGVQTIGLFTSYLFNIKLFSLKMKWKQEKELQTILQFTTTLFEHIPQIVIQSVLIFVWKWGNLITIIALGFNLMILILSIVSYCTRKNALQSYSRHSSASQNQIQNVQLMNLLDKD